MSDKELFIVVDRDGECIDGTVYEDEYDADQEAREEHGMVVRIDLYEDDTEWERDYDEELPDDSYNGNNGRYYYHDSASVTVIYKEEGREELSCYFEEEEEDEEEEEAERRDEKGRVMGTVVWGGSPMPTKGIEEWKPEQKVAVVDASGKVLYEI